VQETLPSLVVTRTSPAGLSSTVKVVPRTPMSADSVATSRLCLPESFWTFIARLPAIRPTLARVSGPCRLISKEKVVFGDTLTVAPGPPGAVSSTSA
jgi:hypothetical protein